LGQLLVVSLPCGQLVQTTPELIPDPIPLQSGDRSRKSKWR